MKRLELYCHVCGQSLPDYFVCTSPADKTDRPFLVHVTCASRLDKDMRAVEAGLRREPAPRAKR